MTMLDDDALAALFAEAADSFEVPADGAADILSRAAGASTDAGDPETTDSLVEPSGLRSLALAQARRARRVAGSHRVLTVAACVVVALGVAAGVSALSHHTPKTPISALAHGTPRLPVKASGPVTPSLGAGVPASSGAATGTGATSSGSATNGFGTATTTTVPSNQSAAQALAPSSASSSVNGTVEAPRIEQSGSLSLRIAKGTLTKAVGQLSYLASAYGGFVSNSQTQSGQDSVSGVPSATVTLEIPVANFETVLKKAQTLGTTEALSTKADNVTSQYVNLQAQIAADQASEQQYLTIMTKATSIGDVLAVQTQLNSIESSIEQLQGQLNLLNSQTTYSSLVTTLTEQSPTQHHHRTPPHHRSGLLSAWDGSVGGFVRGVEGLIRLAGPALFILLCGLALVLGGRTGWRQYQRRTL